MATSTLPSAHAIGSEYGTFAYEIGLWPTDHGWISNPRSVDFGPGGIIAVTGEWGFGRSDYGDAASVKVFHPNGTLDFQFGSRGSGPGEFSEAYGIAFGPGGIIAVSDMLNGIQVFHPNGTFAFQLGSRGLGPGEPSFTEDVAFGPGGIIAVADSSSNRIYVFHPNGTLDFQFGSRGLGPGEFRGPSDVAFGPGGIIAVADSGNHRVQVFHPNGTFAFQPGHVETASMERFGIYPNGTSAFRLTLRGGSGPGEFKGPVGVDFRDDGLIAVAERHARIQVFHPNGTFAFQLGWHTRATGEFSNPSRTLFGPSGIVSMFDNPLDVAFGPDGLIAVADAGRLDRVQVFYPAPDPATMDIPHVLQIGSRGSGPGEFNSPAGVAFGPDGLIAVADPRGDRVQVFRVDGTLAFQIGSRGSGPGEFIMPSGVAFGPRGIIAVADSGNHRIQVFHPDGTFAIEFGMPGAGPGHLYGPYGMDFGPDGLLAVSDMGNSRVHVFRIP